jgi:hypothetical protein
MLDEDGPGGPIDGDHAPYGVTLGNLERTAAAKADIIWRIGLVDQLLTILQELRRSLMVELERTEEEEASALKAEALQALLGEIKDSKLERLK